MLLLQQLAWSISKVCQGCLYFGAAPFHISFCLITAMSDWLAGVNMMQLA